MSKIALIISEYEKKKHLKANQKREIVEYDNSIDTYSSKADTFATELLKNAIDINDNQINCAISLGFCYSVCATFINQKFNLLTRRSGYQDLLVWDSFPFSMLNINAEAIYYDFGFTEEDPPKKDDVCLTEKAEFLKWLFNPNGNTDILDGIFRNLCSYMVKKLTNVIPSSREARHIILNISFPPVSCEFDAPDWNFIFSEITDDNFTINIKNQFKEENVPEDTIRYAVWKHEWGFGICHAVFVYDNSSSQPIDCFACIMNDGDDNIELLPLKVITDTTCQIISKKIIVPAGKKNEKKIPFLSPKNEIPAGLLSFLGCHGAGFYDAVFAVVNGASSSGDDPIIDEVLSILGTSSEQMSYICSRMLKEEKLEKIALSDMVRVGICLDHKKYFKQTVLHHDGNEKIVTKKNLFNSYDVSGLPSNYASTVWKLSKNKSFSPPYWEVESTFLQQIGIKEHIERIISGIDDPNTETIAEEILFNYDLKGYPSSLFIAKLYCYLMENDGFVPIENKHVIKPFTTINSIKTLPKSETKSKSTSTVKSTPKPITVKKTIHTKLVTYENKDIGKPHTMSYLWDKYGNEGVAINVQKKGIKVKDRYITVLGYDEKTQCIKGYYNGNRDNIKAINLKDNELFYIYKKGGLN